MLDVCAIFKSHYGVGHKRLLDRLSKVLNQTKNSSLHPDGTGHSDIETISQEDSGSDTQTTNTLPVEDASTEHAPTVGPTSGDQATLNKSQSD